MLLEMISKPDSQIRLWFDGDQLVGCCQLEFGVDSAYFGLFAVRPRLQGGGVGSRVLTDAEEQAATHGRARMRMTVIAQRDDLIAWYERRGYERTGDTSPFPYGDARYGDPRRADLEFAELVKKL